MHEMSIAMSVIAVVEESVLSQNALKVLTVTVDIGDLAGVSCDALEFCYEACSKEAVVTEGSRLVLNKIPAVALCPACVLEFSPDSQYFVCPECSGPATVLQGDDLVVKSIEVETT